MSDTIQTENWDNPDKSKLPGSLNILTILTFIGCGLGLLFVFGSKKMMEFGIKMADSPEAQARMTDKELADMEKLKSMYEIMSSNWIAYLIPSLIGIALCFFGALQMRKLKKQGFYMYVLGQILPIIGGAIVIGFSNQFSNTSSYVIGMGIPILFIFLYSRNLKYLS